MYSSSMQQHGGALTTRGRSVTARNRTFWHPASLCNDLTCTCMCIRSFVRSNDHQQSSSSNTLTETPQQA